MKANLQERVSAIHQQAVQVQTWTAWSWTVGVSLAAAITAELIDFLLRLRSWPLRILLTASVVAVVVWAVRRWLVPWWHSSFSNVQVARRLEQLHPRLGERLSSAIAFLQQATDDPREGSLELRYAVVADAESIAADLPLESSIDRRPARRALAFAVALAIAALAIGLWQPTNFGRALARLVWPVGGPMWPPRNQLELVTAPTAVALGESFEVQLIDRNGHLPDDATITLQFDEPARRTERHLLQQRGEKLVFRIEQVLTGFRYRVTGGDDDSLPWHELQVVQPPKLTDLVSATEPPAYSGLKPERGGRLVKMLAGSQLMIEGRLDRAASAVRLQTATKEPLPEVQLAADRLSFHSPANSPWQPTKSQHVWIELVDETGSVTGRDGPLELQVIPDSPPSLAWDQPGDHGAFTSQALIPISAVAKDDLAVQRVELHYASIGSEPQQPQVVVLFEQAKPPARNFGEGDSRPITHVWDVSQAVKAAEGASFSLQLVAYDFHGQQTSTPPRRISLISTQDMQHRLVQRQGVVLEQLGEILRLQRQARTLVNDVAARQQDEGKWQTRDLDALQSADLQQRQVQRLLKNPDDGLTKQIDLMLAELKANRLQDEGIASRMESLQKQVARLCDDVLPTLEEQLAAALKTARLKSEATGDCADDSPLSLDGVTEQQNLAVAALEAMLGELAQWDNFSRISREVALLKQEQQKLREQTENVRVTLALAERDAEPLNLARQTAQRQLEAARLYDKLQGRMESLLAKLRDSDPLAAGSLADALDAATRLAIGGQMRSAARQLQEARAGQAVQSQDQVLAGLSEVLDRLASRRDQDAKRQLASLTAAAAELNNLTQRSENLAREAAAAAQANDPQKRQLQRLTKDAQRLAEEVAELARKLERLKAKKPGDSLKKAGQALGGTSQSAAGGNGGEAEQQARSALEDLQKAKQELQQDIQQAQEDLVREQLARLEAELAGLLKRQQNLVTETERLDGFKQANNGALGRAQQASLRSLAQEQRQLADAVQQSSEAFSSGETFQLALDGVRQQMQRAHRGLVRSQTDDSVIAPQQQAVARLKQLITAARSQDSAPENEEPAEQGPQQQTGGQPEVRSIGELQLLAQLQTEINRRTTELETARVASGDFTAEQQTELQELAAEQGKLAEIILKLVEQPTADAAEDNNSPAPQPPADTPPPPQKKSGNPLDEELLKDLK
ncbi:hypothetical protein ETAA8_70580 [Anatilimnocola aggregata]|uniref:Uncharacterized protein n=1 Tax=Anatilimnocola aggregata TaxID=2528021 RepID=A0A517YNV4_9BACT|nr:hypothetical protein [Anatilimnocola aggregata]QDU31896.1 hypothetical protein ETAA8_70580 [Anatilimnocola aggregata]